MWKNHGGFSSEHDVSWDSGTPEAPNLCLDLPNPDFTILKRWFGTPLVVGFDMEHGYFFPSKWDDDLVSVAREHFLDLGEVGE
jgi:hypothetical protein